jgi:HK97 family phage prohead protease
MRVEQIQMLEFKRAPIIIEATSETGIVSGYANVFGVKDLGNDIVHKGAFSGGIEGKKFPLLWSHNPDEPPIGGATVKEDNKGLYLEGALTLSIPRARDVFEALKAKTIDGLSVGFKTLEKELKDGVRHILKAELWEVSIVNFPMNQDSFVDAVKAADMTDREIERKLTQDAGFTRSMARLLMKGGVTALRTKQDAGESAQARMLQTILDQLKSMKEG